MKCQFGTAIVLAFAAITIPAAASAQDSATRPPPDANEKVCETVTTIGSRIAAKKVCATRAEWAQKRKDDRNLAEDIQHGMGFNRCTDSPGGARKGTVSC